jgi:hypothetical protein
MLDLHDRINERFLEIVNFIAFLSLSFGTTHFIAEGMSTRTNILVFVHVLSQFAYRMLALTCFCVRFKLYALCFIFPSWLITYLLGPQETISYWRYVCIERATEPPEERESLKVLLFTLFAKLFSTPLVFFIAMDVVFKRSEDVREQLSEGAFLVWRMVENAIVLLLFIFLPLSEELRPADEYEGWMTHTYFILAGSIVCAAATLVSWKLIEPPPPFQPQVDLSTGL